MSVSQTLTGEYRGDTYHSFKQISKGAYGTVFAAVRQRPGGQDTSQQPQGEPVAIKFIPLNPYVDYLKMVKREVVIVNQLTHPHIVRVRDLVKESHFVDEAGVEKPAIGLVMDLARCSLQNYLQKYKQLPEGAVRWWFQQLMLAIDHCHNKKVVQRDIKPGNILIFAVPESKNTHILKLADFGWAKRFDLSAPKSMAGTPVYAAPEVLGVGNPPPTPANPQKPYNPEAADVWSCGVVLFQLLYTVEFEIITKKLPPMTAVTNWVDRIPPVATGGRSSDCGNLLRKMLKVAPEERATMQQVMSHTWFTEGLPPGARELNSTAGHEVPLIQQPVLEEWIDAVIYKFTGVDLKKYASTANKAAATR